MYTKIEIPAFLQLRNFGLVQGKVKDIKINYRVENTRKELFYKKKKQADWPVLKINASYDTLEQL